MESRPFAENTTVKKTIREIERRPCLWDPAHEDYTDKVCRVKAWEEVCEAVTPGFLQMDYRDRSNIEVVIKKKWKCLKDCFRRDCIKQSKEGQPSRYRYSKRLQFLLKEKTDHAIEDETISDKNDENSDDSDTPILFTKKAVSKKQTPSNNKKTPKPLKKRSKPNISSPKANESNRTETIQQLYIHRMPSINEPIADDDEDRLFLLSLIKDLKKIPEDYKLEAKCEIMKVVRKFKMVAHTQYTMDSSFTYEPVQKKLKKKKGKSVQEPEEDDSDGSYVVAEYEDEDNVEIKLVQKSKKIKTENPLSEEELIL